MSSTSFDLPNLLDPLADFPLFAPFPDDIDFSGAPLLGLYNDPINAPAPELGRFLAPLPSLFPEQDLSFSDVHPPLGVSGAADLVVRDDTLIPPPAPRLKDLDSFSDGTALGSFNYSLASEHDIPMSVAFSPANPMRSIETWRTDVQRCLREEEEQARYCVAQALSGRRRLPTPEEPATKRRRVSELPFVHAVIEPFLRAVAERVASARADGVDDGGAHHEQGGRVEQGPRAAPSAMAIVRPSSAPPGTDVG
ncbi:hypothetical protein OF83DRAFT_564384 [Amylostereum chailletii]|nr:hypothetical protein OF83DRAFT_564384 [Amylostereum chailletii]